MKQYSLRQFWTWRSKNWGFVVNNKGIAYVMTILNMLPIYFSYTCFKVIGISVSGVPYVTFYQKCDILVYIYNKTREPIKLTHLLDKTGYNVSIFHKVTYCHQSIFALRILSELFCPFIFCKKLSLLTCLLWVYSFSSNLFRGITSFLGSLWTLVPIEAKKYL